MLKKSYLYQSQIVPLLCEASIEEKNKYYAEWFWTLDYENNYDEFEEQSFVSIDRYENIVGFIHCKVNRGVHGIRNLSIIRFNNDHKYNILFAKDIKKFFDLMFKFYNYNKISFEICVDSPYEKMYDKFSKKYGGRVVGIKKNEFLTLDGEIHDLKLYEIMQEDYLRKMKFRKVK